MDTRVAELEPITHRPSNPAGRVVGVIVVAAVVGLAGVLVAGGGKPLPTVDVFTRAARQTAGSGTVRASVVATVSVGSRSVKIAEITSDTDFHSRVLATVTTSTLQQRIRFVDGISYISVPGVALPHGAHWVSITSADLHADPNASASVGSRDPSSGLQFLSAVEGSPRVVDTGHLDGVAVTHYAFTLDLKALFDRVGRQAEALNSSSFAKSIKTLGTLVDLSAVPGEAWIDGQGRVRKFRFSITASEDGQTVSAADEFRFSHFGEPIVVQAPEPSDTVPFRENRDFFSKVAAAARARSTTG
jgi:hypothetical protein